MHSGSLWKLRFISTCENFLFHSWTSASLICSQKLTSKNLNRLHDFRMLENEYKLFAFSNMLGAKLKKKTHWKQISDVIPRLPNKSICSKSGQLSMKGYRSLSFMPRRVPMKSFFKCWQPLASERKQSPGMLTPKLTKNERVNYSTVRRVETDDNSNSTNMCSHFTEIVLGFYNSTIRKMFLFYYMKYFYT